jgi:hypothetical protein
VWKEILLGLAVLVLAMEQPLENKLSTELDASFDYLAERRSQIIIERLPEIVAESVKPPAEHQEADHHG